MRAGSVDPVMWSRLRLLAVAVGLLLHGGRAVMAAVE